MIFDSVRQEVSNFDSSVVVYELELAINRALYSFLCSLGSQKSLRIVTPFSFNDPVLVSKFFCFRFADIFSRHMKWFLVALFILGGGCFIVFTFCLIGLIPDLKGNIWSVCKR